MEAEELNHLWVWCPRRGEKTAVRRAGQVL